VIGTKDEDISDLVGGGGDAAPAPAPKAEKKSAKGKKKGEVTEESEVEPEAPAAGTAATAVPSPAEVEVATAPATEGRVKASPLARRLAADEGLELRAIQGSGPGGRIVKRDVERAAQDAPVAPAAAKAPAFALRLTPPDSTEDFRDVALSQMRKTIAKRLVESIGPVPHFFLTVDVDMSRVVEARERANALLESTGVKVSFNDIVLKATAAALRRHPECNAHWGGDHIRHFNRVHLGVAVAIEDGLITPVVRDAHLKGIAEIAVEVRELAGRAREKKLKPDEYTGATFSVSNLGMFGIEEFTAVINPPEAGILAVGALEERAVVVKGEVKVQPRMKITMSCDHRVIDGAQGSAFLRTLRAILEEPLTALL
jgi:pyruvate dehydrogenase E2 component (dihydrolipoamide acetyltransferase)